MRSRSPIARICALFLALSLGLPSSASALRPENAERAGAKETIREALVPVKQGGLEEEHEGPHSILDVLKREFPEERELRILDVGAMDGKFLTDFRNVLEQDGHFRPICVALDPEFSNPAHRRDVERLEQAGIRAVPAQIEDIASTSYPIQSFHVITMNAIPETPALLDFQFFVNLLDRGILAKNGMLILRDYGRGHGRGEHLAKFLRRRGYSAAVFSYEPTDLPGGHFPLRWPAIFKPRGASFLDPALAQANRDDHYVRLSAATPRGGLEEWWRDPSKTYFAMSVPIFSLRRDAGDPGIGKFTDLGPIYREMLAHQGVTVVVLLPPFAVLEESPYAPASSYALNELFIDWAAVPEARDDPALAGRLPLDQRQAVHYARVRAREAGVATRAYRRFREMHLTSQPSARGQALLEFVRQQKHWLEPYAAWRALHDMFHTPSYMWLPDQVRRAREDPEYQESVDRQRYLQWLAAEQFAEAVRQVHNAGGRLLLDLPMFRAKDSAETWWKPTWFRGVEDPEQYPGVVHADVEERWRELALWDWTAVHREGFAPLLDPVRYWLARGMDGLRIDALHFAYRFRGQLRRQGTEPGSAYVAALADVIFHQFHRMAVAEAFERVDAEVRASGFVTIHDGWRRLSDHDDDGGFRRNPRLDETIDTFVRQLEVTLTDWKLGSSARFINLALGHAWGDPFPIKTVDWNDDQRTTRWHYRIPLPSDPDWEKRARFDGGPVLAAFAARGGLEEGKRPNNILTADQFEERLIGLLKIPDRAIHRGGVTVRGRVYPYTMTEVLVDDSWAGEAPYFRAGDLFVVSAPALRWSASSHHNETEIWKLLAQCPNCVVVEENSDRRGWPAYRYEDSGNDPYWVLPHMIGVLIAMQELRSAIAGHPFIDVGSRNGWIAAAALKCLGATHAVIIEPDIPRQTVVFPASQKRFGLPESGSLIDINLKMNGVQDRATIYPTFLDHVPALDLQEAVLAYNLEYFGSPYYNQPIIRDRYDEVRAESGEPEAVKRVYPTKAMERHLIDDVVEKFPRQLRWIIASGGDDHDVKGYGDVRQGFASRAEALSLRQAFEVTLTGRWGVWHELEMETATLTWTAPTLVFDASSAAPHSPQHETWEAVHHGIIEAIRRHPGGRLTTAALATAAGVSRPTLYRHGYRALVAAENARRAALTPPGHPILLAARGRPKNAEYAGLEEMIAGVQAAIEGALAAAFPKARLEPHDYRITGGHLVTVTARQDDQPPITVDAVVDGEGQVSASLVENGRVLHTVTSGAHAFAEAIRELLPRGGLEEGTGRPPWDTSDKGLVVQLSSIWGVREQPITDEKMIEAIVDPPLVEACKILFRKGIRTLASSANSGDRRYFGAWIQIDPRSLSPENRVVAEAMTAHSGEDGFLEKSTESDWTLFIPFADETTIGQLSAKASALANQFVSQPTAPRASRDGRVVSGHGESRAPARESPSTEASGLEESRKPPKPLEAYREEFYVGRELLAKPYKLGGGGSGVVATVRSRDRSIFSGFIPRSLASGYANDLGRLFSTRKMIPVRVIESRVDRQGERLVLKFRVWDRTIQERLARLGTIREGMELTVKNVRRGTEGLHAEYFEVPVFVHSTAVPETAWAFPADYWMGKEIVVRVDRKHENNGRLDASFVKVVLPQATAGSVIPVRPAQLLARRYRTISSSDPDGFENFVTAALQTGWKQTELERLLESAKRFLKDHKEYPPGLLVINLLFAVEELGKDYPFIERTLGAAGNQMWQSPQTHFDQGDDPLSLLLYQAARNRSSDSGLEEGTMVQEGSVADVFAAVRRQGPARNYSFAVELETGRMLAVPTVVWHREAFRRQGLDYEQAVEDPRFVFGHLFVMTRQDGEVAQAIMTFDFSRGAGKRRGEEAMIRAARLLRPHLPDATAVLFLRPSWAGGTESMTLGTLAGRPLTTERGGSGLEQRPALDAAA